MPTLGLHTAIHRTCRLAACLRLERRPSVFAKLKFVCSLGFPIEPANAITIETLPPRIAQPAPSRLHRLSPPNLPSAASQIAARFCPDSVARLDTGPVCCVGSRLVGPGAAGRGPLLAVSALAAKAFPKPSMPRRCRRTLTLSPRKENRVTRARGTASVLLLDRPRRPFVR